jgi:hypothetical protein
MRINANKRAKQLFSHAALLPKWEALITERGPLPNE